MLYQINLGRACGGIVVEKGIVTKTAPIFKWMQGETLYDIRRWLAERKEKGGTITLVSREAREIPLE